MKILHVVESLSEETGGPARTVVNLARYQSNHHHVKVSILSRTLAANGQESNLSQSPVENILFNNTGSGVPGIGLGVLPGRNPLEGQFDSLDILHNHGLWLPINHFASRIAREKHIPLVWHPRGMLEPWSLNFKRLKKKLALALYQREDLRSAELFFATAEQEAENLRRFGIEQPIAIIPNGVVLPELDLQVESRQDSRNANGAEKTVLFLSRIHPKKGILNLLKAWSEVVPKSWKLMLAGPDEAGHLKKVYELIAELGLQAVVDVVGSVNDQDKSIYFRKADIFVLPSYSENFGLVVAEALAHGLPTIATRGAPWESLQTHKCGWWVEPTVAGLKEALRDAATLETAELRRMGERGRLFARCFDWNQIADETLAVYRWLLRKGDMPKCVVLD